MSSQQQAVARSLDIISNDLGITDSSAASRVFEASLGAGTTQLIRAAGGVAARNVSDQQIADAVHKVRQVSHDAGLSSEKALVHAAIAGGGFETGGQGSRRGASELKAAHDSAVAYERQAASSLSEAQALRSAASVVTRDGFSVTGDDTYAIHRRAEAEGVSRGALNDPGIMMDVARRHFLEKYGSDLGAALSDLDPNGPKLSLDQVPGPTFSDGRVASPGVVDLERSESQGKVSSLNQSQGVAEEGEPGIRDAAGHFVDTKLGVQRDVDERTGHVDNAEQVLQGERARRYESASMFNDRNPGGKPEVGRPSASQPDTFEGAEDASNQYP